MFTNNGVAKNSDKGKRKMTEFHFEINPKETRMFNLGSSQHLDGRLLQVQRILNNTAPLIKPFSYMSLLTAPDEEEEDDINSLIKNTTVLIDHKISIHNENLKQSLEGALRDLQERAAKRVKDKEEEALQRNTELERMVEHHKAKAERLAKREEELERMVEHHKTKAERVTKRGEELERMVKHHKAKAERLQIRVRGLERTKVCLRRRLSAGAGGRYLEIEEEEGESETGPGQGGRVGPITLECKVCKMEMASMMLWPCRHVSVCKGCEAATRYCPVCAHITTTAIQLLLPLD